MKLVVGLTGGIGSGKSAAADEFARLGATVVDTDLIAHELTRAGGAAMPQLERVFGTEMLDATGAMDRARMRERAFADPTAKKQLEALLHPLIREESRRRIQAAQGPYVVHVVPLLVESPDYRKRVDRVLVVDCPEDLQIARVRARSALPESQVRAIIATQATRAERLATADDVIDNSGSLDALRKQVAALHRRYLEYGKQAPAG
jgi:dephospho-CoA kinase